MAVKRKKRKAVSLDDVRKSMTTALYELEGIYFDEANDVDQRIRAINSLSSLANSYAKITEISDLEERITQLEQTIQTNGKATKQQT